MAQGDGCIGENVTGKVGVGAESGGGTYLPEDIVCLGTVDQIHQAVSTGAEGGASLKKPDGICVPLGIERQGAGERKGSGVAVNATRKGEPGEVKTAP